jgi:hypothetical protein
MRPDFWTTAAAAAARFAVLGEVTAAVVSDTAPVELTAVAAVGCPAPAAPAACTSTWK